MISKVELENSIELVAIAEKMEKILAEENEKSQVTYAFDGKGYTELLNEHKIDINSANWDKLSLGNITINRKRK